MGNSDSQNKRKIESFGWMQVKKCPIYGIHKEWSIPIQRVSTESIFIIIINDSLYTYNTRYNSWKVQAKINITSGGEMPEYKAIAYDRNQNKLQLFIDYSGFSFCRYFELDLTTFECINKSQMAIHSSVQYNSSNTFTFINNELHSVGFNHSIWSKNKEIFQRINGFNGPRINAHNGSGSIYLQAQQRFLTLNLSSDKRSIKVYEYNFMDKYWKELKINPHDFRSRRHSHFIAMCCRDEQYILIIYADAIIMNEIVTGRVNESAIKAPDDNGLVAGIVMKETRSPLMTMNGFIRKVMNNKLISQDIMDLIASMMGDDEYLHLIYHDSGNHYRISVDSLFSRSR